MSLVEAWKYMNQMCSGAMLSLWHSSNHIEYMRPVTWFDASVQLFFSSPGICCDLFFINTNTWVRKPVLKALGSPSVRGSSSNEIPPDESRHEDDMRDDIAEAELPLLESDEDAVTGIAEIMRCTPEEFDNQFAFIYRQGRKRADVGVRYILCSLLESPESEIK